MNDYSAIGDLLLKEGSLTFTAVMFEAVNRQPFRISPHHRIICRKLDQVHTEASVSADINADFIRAACFRADACSDTVTHCAKTAGGQKRAGLRIMIILRRPHLMLSDVGCDNRIAFRNAI